MGRVGSGLQDLNKVAVPGSYDDIRDGLTVPADASNDFTAVAMNGLKVQLIQLQRWTPRGVEVWKPDGTPLPASRQIPDDWRRHDPSELHIFSRFENDGSLDPNRSGIGSGPHSPEDPPSQSFFGGYVMPSKGSTETTVAFFGSTELGSSGTISFSYSIAEKAGKAIYTVYPNGDRPNYGSIPESLASEFVSDFPSTVHINYPAYGTPFTRGKNGEDDVKDGHGGYLHDKVLSTELTYTELINSGNYSLEPVVYGAQTLKPIEQDWNEAHQRENLMDISNYWPVPPQDIDHIDFVLRKSYHVVYLNVHLRPNQDKP
jgi:hypothetical protein